MKDFWNNILIILGTVEDALIGRHDRLKHFFVGFFVYVILSFFFVPALALFLTGAVGLAKEVYDGLTGRGNADFWDCIYVWIPAIVLFLIELYGI